MRPTENITQHHQLINSYDDDDDDDDDGDDVKLIYSSVSCSITDGLRSSSYYATVLINRITGLVCLPLRAPTQNKKALSRHLVQLHVENGCINECISSFA